jgi:hypothetical protein
MASILPVRAGPYPLVPYPHIITATSSCVAPRVPAPHLAGEREQVAAAHLFPVMECRRDLVLAQVVRCR